MTDQVTVPVADTVTEDQRNAILVGMIRERQRIIEKLGAGTGYGTARYSATALKMIRDMFPDMGLTREVWAALGGGVTEYERGGPPPRDWRATVDAWHASIDATVAQITGQPSLPDMPDVAPTVRPVESPPADKPALPDPDEDQDDEEDEDEEPDRTCECDGCTDDHCQGDCDQCRDHECEQCFDGHGVCHSCGYCSDCDEHADGDWPTYGHAGRCNQDHCHECEHDCANY